MPVAKDFTISTTFNKTAKNSDLQVGKPVDLVVEVTAKADAEYVMIEVPIPAGCSYAAKTGNNPFEVHREYYKQKVSIFCDKLPQGKHSFKIQLLPRFSGNYVLNPAKAELMYFPLFFGRNKIEQVKVK